MAGRRPDPGPARRMEEMTLRNRRLAIAGLVTAAAANLAVAGCTVSNSPSTNQSSAPASSAPAGARQELAAALAPMSDTPFHVVVTGGSVTGTGDADPTQKNLQMTLDITQPNGTAALKVDVRTLGDQMWLRLHLTGTQVPGAAAIEGKWLHIDTTKLGPRSQAGIASATGPVDTTKLVDSANNVRKVDATHYQGTVDLTQGSSLAIDQSTLSALAGKAKSIPFEATVDGQNRLAELKITIPAVGDQPQQVIDSTYSNYGTPVTVTAPPAGQVVQAPQFAYELFKS